MSIPDGRLREAIEDYIAKAETYRLRSELLFNGPISITQEMMHARDALRALLASPLHAGATTGTIEVIVNGQPVIVKAGTVRDVISQAVELSGQIGAPSEQWQLRTTEGDVIPHDMVDGTDYELAPGRRLWLNLSPPALHAGARQHSNVEELPWKWTRNGIETATALHAGAEPEGQDELRAVAGWRCFHCGLVLTTEQSAREHFGPTRHDIRACDALSHPAVQQLEFRHWHDIKQWHDMLSDLVDSCYTDGSSSAWRLCGVCETEHHREAMKDERTHSEGCMVDEAERLLHAWQTGLRSTLTARREG